MKVLITHMSDDTNRGDLAILTALVQRLHECADPVEVSIASAELTQDEASTVSSLTGKTLELQAPLVGTPVASLARHKGGAIGWFLTIVAWEVALRLPATVLHALARRSPFLAVAADVDVAIGKGGSYLYSHGGLRNLLYFWRMCLPLRMLHRLGKPLVLYAVSVGPWSGRAARSLARMTLAGCTEVVAREEVSAAQIRELVPSVPVRVVPDLALSLSVAVAPIHNQVAVTVRRLPFSMSGESRNIQQVRYEHGIVQSLDRWMTEDASLRVIFVPQVTGDAELSRSLASRLAAQDRVSVSAADLSIDELIQIYSASKLVLATRLHSGLLALACHTPVVHLMYDLVKQPGTLRLLGLERWGLPAGVLDAESLTILGREALADQEAMRADIAQRMQGVRLQHAGDVCRALSEARRRGSGHHG